MATAPTEHYQDAAAMSPTGLDISIRTGAGTGRTLLSAFDHALHLAGVADFNLVTLSSVIPTGSRIRHVDARLPGGHGDLLFCVRAQAFAEHPGDVAWAGLGWVTDETGGGLFVEHHGTSEQAVVDQIELSLADMKTTRGGTYGPVSVTVVSADCVDQPVCALAVAAYRVSPWHDGVTSDVDPEPALATAPEPHLTEVGPEAARHHRVGPRSTHGMTVTVAETSEPPLHDDEVVASRALVVPDAATGAVARVTVEREVDYATARSYYRLYQQSFAMIETLAVARHMLHESEFLEEMLDPRVRKYIAWDHDDQAIGMTTLTTELDTVPWVSPSWFAERFPDHVARGALYYFGFALVHPDHQGAKVLHAMIEPMALEVLEHRGVVAWDLCAVNDARGFGKTYMQLLSALGEVSIETIDTQTYYAAEYHGPRQTGPADDSRGVRR